MYSSFSFILNKSLEYNYHVQRLTCQGTTRGECSPCPPKGYVFTYQMVITMTLKIRRLFTDLYVICHDLDMTDPFARLSKLSSLMTK